MKRKLSALVLVVVRDTELYKQTMLVEYIKQHNYQHNIDKYQQDIYSDNS